MAISPKAKTTGQRRRTPSSTSQPPPVSLPVPPHPAPTARSPSPSISATRAPSPSNGPSRITSDPSTLSSSSTSAPPPSSTAPIGAPSIPPETRSRSRSSRTISTISPPPKRVTCRSPWWRRISRSRSIS
ncbi:hypothetical protein CASFOL_014178 [Castilleja foliolosa]|uniref:Uncharacterized protein n=1 Tax=Castilleja foliolosa TaxID=1961234 RepID=A0ABD3DM47_9LAMI